LFRVDGLLRRIEIAMSRPQRDPDAMARLFRERVTALCAQNEDPLANDYGFDLVQLAVMAAERVEGRQEGLPDAASSEPPAAPLLRGGDDRSRSLPGRDAVLAAPAHSSTSQPEDLADLVDRLGARLGLRRVLRAQPHDTHIPEFAVAWVEASRAPPVTPRPTASRSISGAAPTRPLRLFATPEPVEAVAEVPDGPPRRFRWRRVMHDVAAIEGPERIAPDWWKQHANALTRDYFRVEDTQGQRYWLYREGLYEQETTRPRWFMHGLFA
jgi:protein ImuB